VAVDHPAPRAGAVLRAAGLLTVLAAALLVWPARPAFAAPAESIASYDTRVDVRADGGLRVVETIAYDFGGNSRHGIERRIPTSARYDDTRDRVYPVDDVSVTMDGAAVPVQRGAKGRYVVLRIGDPDHTVTGTHTYVIGYTVDGAVNSFADHEELYWNAVGTDWGVPIRTARAQVTGPAPVLRATCFAGSAGSRASCTEASVHAATATFRQAGLDTGSALTVVVAFPVGSVANAGPMLVEREDSANVFRATPFTVGGAVALGLLGIVAALTIAWRTGRDRRYVGTLPGLIPERGERAVERRKPLIGAPPLSVEFGPPYGIRPAQAGTLIDERADVVDVTATIIDFAVRRHLHIRQLPKGKPDWELSKLTNGDRTFRWYERTLFNALFDGRQRVRLSELKQTFGADLATVRKQLYAEMVDQGWYRQSPARTRSVARTTAVIILLASLGVMLLLAGFTQAALLGLGLIVGSLVLLLVAGRFPARTGKGSAVLARVLGFRLYIATAEAEQMKFQEREQIFSEFLPYAMVFGLTERWARTFADMGGARPDGTGDLYWYSGPTYWGDGRFNEAIGGFSAAAAVAVAASTPSASGSSGFSASGFSGGGGGGGGGGSW
jgi:uncharacterized membrane protein YgcG